MYKIAEAKLYNNMLNRNNLKPYMRDLIETEFWLALQSDIIKILHKDSAFAVIPDEFKEEAIKDICQDSLMAIWCNIDGFLSNESSIHGGARANYLKTTVHYKACDFLNNNKDMFGCDIPDDLATKSYTDISISEIQQFAKFYHLFTNVNYRYTAKITYFYKMIYTYNNKKGKNGGLSGKHNVLPTINGKSYYELGIDIIDTLHMFASECIPNKYLYDVAHSIGLTNIQERDSMKQSIFHTIYSTAEGECSRVKKILNNDSDIIDDLALQIYYDIEDKIELMS